MKKRGATQAGIVASGTALHRRQQRLVSPDRLGWE
jgi:hypothetical protein